MYVYMFLCFGVMNNQLVVPSWKLSPIDYPDAVGLPAARADDQWALL